MCIHQNRLIRKFSYCTVKKKLFTTFCLCLYDVALSVNFIAHFRKLAFG